MLLVLVLAIVCGVLVDRTAALGQEQQTDPAMCSLATLHGSYGGQFSGVAFMDDGSRRGEYVGNGMGIFDGDGNLTNRFTGMSNGKPFAGTSTGTYTLEPDCTGTAILAVTQASGSAQLTRSELFVVGEGKDIFLVQKEPGGVNQLTHWVKF